MATEETSTVGEKLSDGEKARRSPPPLLHRVLLSPLYFDLCLSPRLSFSTMASATTNLAGAVPSFLPFSSPSSLRIPSMTTKASMGRCFLLPSLPSRCRRISSGTKGAR
ncbi:hypothetical protein PIB30_075811, partial [Stylosanthes scabra]|nr:hypothetical protein [Stylosanthes scabra]